MSNKEILFVRKRQGGEDGAQIFDDRLVSAMSRLIGDSLEVLQYDSKSKHVYRGDTEVTGEEKDRLVNFCSHVILSDMSTFDFCQTSNRLLIHLDVPHDAYISVGGLVNLFKAAYLKRKLLPHIDAGPFNFFISDREYRKYRSMRSAGRLYVGVNTKKTHALPERFSPSMLISGNYKWSLKINSLRQALDCLVNYSNDIYFASACAVGRQIVQESSLPVKFMHKPEGLLTYGLISDRFTSGFKLKTLDLIQQNCVLLSFTDISNEFLGVTNSELFVRHVTDRKSIERAQRSVESLGNSLIPLYISFRQDVERQFSWDRSAKIILEKVFNGKDCKYAE